MGKTLVFLFFLLPATLSAKLRPASPSKTDDQPQPTSTRRYKLGDVKEPDIIKPSSQDKFEQFLQVVEALTFYYLWGGGHITARSSNTNVTVSK